MAAEQTAKAEEFIHRIMNWERDYDPEDRQVASRFCTFVREYKAALDRAREEAIEECAKECLDWQTNGIVPCCIGPDSELIATDAWNRACIKLAAAIRARKGANRVQPQ